MYFRVVISAKFKKDYETRVIGAWTKPNGQIHVDFPRDMDFSETFTMIWEPDDFENADKQQVDGFGETPLNQDLSEIPIKARGGEK
jgi:hypothetical protein